MMRSFYLCLLSIVILFISACQTSGQIQPIKEETIDFDMKTAIEMVEKKEKMIIDVALREKVSKLEYKELEKSFTEEFRNNADIILSILFTHNMDADPESDIYVQQNTLYPTVFHKGITITNAVINKSYFVNDQTQTRLSIKEDYNGDDEKLKGWEREYIFTLNENGEWRFNGFSGEVNFLGEDYNMNYLELKR
ncbi:hypothetical protein [Paenibacillus alvei]|uniref:Lipoprotein n=1 Tax=Paenibacillus alvei TaxID=44250 RepID=A0A383RBM9_PAEAL|nr:hypothetical protein [Paenibacillus alvei]SYX83934.1 conserved exported protein of unknown function [Paenibacillus alvei]